MSPNRFKSALGRAPGSPPIGSWLMSAAPAVAEAMGYCGFDFLVVDMEHSPLDLGTTVALLRAIAPTPAEPLVRLASAEPVRVKQVLDAGACSLMFPQIGSAEEARAAVAYTRYPPQGVRGVAAVHRGSHYGRSAGYLQGANEQIAVVMQLETPEAIEQLAAIAAVPGVDALFVGPADLSAALGHIGEIGHETVQAQIALAARRARAAGKSIGIVAPNPEMLQRFFAYGYTWGAIGSDIGLLTGRSLEWLAALKSTAAPGTAGAY